MGSLYCRIPQGVHGAVRAARDQSLSDRWRVRDAWEATLSDPAMTLRRYAHVLEDMREDAARAMDDLF